MNRSRLGKASREGLASLTPKLLPATIDLIIAGELIVSNRGEGCNQMGYPLDVSHNQRFVPEQNFSPFGLNQQGSPGLNRLRCQ